MKVSKETESSPLITTIIPAYNVEEYVINAIQSVLDQSYKNVELIIVNDGSTDNTEQIIKENYPSINLITQKNKGLSGARNTGIENSKGEYIAFLDADDQWLPDKLEKQVEFALKHNNVSVFSTNVYNTLGIKVLNKRLKSKKIFRDKKIKEGIITDYLKQKKKYSFHIPSSMLVKTKIFIKYGNFDIKLRSGEDSEIVLRWAINGEAFGYQDEALTYYQVDNPNSLTKNIPQWASYNIKYWMQIENKYNLKESVKRDFNTLRRNSLLSNNISILILLGYSKIARGYLWKYYDILKSKKWFFYIVISYLPISKFYLLLLKIKKAIKKTSLYR